MSYLGRSRPAPITLPSGSTVDTAAFRGLGRLAFVSDGQLYLLNGASGSIRAIGVPAGLVASKPAWSYDGRWLAFVETAADGSTGNPLQRVWVARDDGSEAHNLSPTTGSFSWLPRSDELALNTAVPGASADQTSAILDVSTGRYRTVCACAGGVWSLDGRTIAFSAALRTPARAPDGTFQFGGAVDTATADDKTETVWATTDWIVPEILGWWPDGRGVLLWEGTNSASSAADGLPLASLDVGSTTPRVITTTLRYGAWIRWSPSTNTLAVVSGGGRSVWSGKSVAICQAAAGCRPLPQPPGQVSLDPAWSPTGRQLVFVRAPADFENESGGWGAQALAAWDVAHVLWVANADRSDAHRIAGGQGASDPSYSADGKTILFIRDNAVWALPAQGGRARRVAGPLYAPAGLEGYYGLIRWADSIAWASS